MNRNKLRVTTEFTAETRFELQPNTVAPFRATQETEFERLKNELLTRQLATAAVPGVTAALRRAANEAAAIAWATPVPLLIFPTLFEEKIDAAIRQAERQARIFRNSRDLVAA